MLIDDHKNHGVILGDILESDLFLGQNERVRHTINLENYDWYRYFSTGEVQLGTYYDTMGCVTFSALNVLEAVFNYLIRNDKISQDNVDWLWDNGYLKLNENMEIEMDCSDRFIVSLSGTTQLGNTGGKVWWTIRNYGVVPETVCKWDSSRSAPFEERFAEWYRDPANVSEEAKGLGKEFLKRFNIFYERVQTNKEGISDGLKHSPIQVFIPTACPYENGVQQACSAKVTHAVSLIDDRGDNYPLFDHYYRQPNKTGQDVYLRPVSKDYPFYLYGYVCTVEEIIQEDMQNNFVRIVKDKNSAAVGFFLPATSPATIENMALLYGKKVPKTEDGGIDWNKFIEGEVEFE